jgi:scyllo-inositol 2-dehydrogenase (NADP+)
MKRLKAVMVGVGRIGWQFHMPSIVKNKGFELAAAADPLEDRRAETEKEFGIRTYDDPIAMYDAEKPDLAVIASPSHLHAEHAIAAFERGIDVFCDKPMAVTLTEGDSMIAAMKRTGRKLMVFQPMRIERMTLAARSIIAEGLLGDVYMLKVADLNYVRRNDWQALRQYGGGTLNNGGSHTVDCMLYLAGSRATSVSCHLRRIASLGDAEDVVKMLIQAENGMLLDIDINFAAAVDGVPRWIILGSRGSAVYHAEEEGWGWFELKYFDSLPDKKFNAGTAAPDRKYISDSIPWKTDKVRLDAFEPDDYYDYCYDYFALGKTPFVPIEQTREVIRVISEARAVDGNFPL